jgi:hypothetical protein
MKKFIFTLIILLNFTLTQAQSMFDKYEDYDDVTSVIVTDEMFKLLKEIEPESQEAREEINVLGNLTGLKVFVTENNQTSQEITADAQKYIRDKKMIELMRINDKDAKVKFYIIKSNKPHIAKELIMIVNGTDADKKNTVVMLVTGSIDLKKLSKLNSKVKIINSKYLKKVEEEQSNE